MSKQNGSKPIQRLAAALRSPPVEELAAALQECLDDAVERGAKRSEKRIEEKWGPRFDRQDETLRMLWRQCGGRHDQRLPIDD